MDLILWAFGGLAYLFTGYVLGRMDNVLYYDDTPSEKAGYLKKTARILFHPFNVFIWDKRTFGDGGGFLRVLTGSVSMDSDNLVKENYCRAHSFLWPLRIFPLAIGLIEILFFCVFKIISGVTIIPPAMCGLLDRGRRRARYTFGAGQDLDGQVAETEGLLAVLSEEKNDLEKLAADLIKKAGDAKDNLKGWDDLGLKLKDKNVSVVAKYAADSLRAEIAKLEERRKSFEDLLLEMEEEKNKISVALEMLRRCRQTVGLGLALEMPSVGIVKSDGPAVLMSQCVSESRNVTAKAREILKRAEILTA